MSVRCFIMAKAFLFFVLVSISFVYAQESRGTTFGQNVPRGQLFTETSHPEEFCLAQNIYWESRPDNLAGMAAVADVVLNRMHDDRWPNTICEVVKQGPVYESWKTRQTEDPDDAVFYPKRNRCQFSWYCDGKPEKVLNPDENTKWRQAQEIAYKMVHQNYLRGISEGATHYHATYVDPSWAKEFQLIGRIGLHIFYRQN